MNNVLDMAAMMDPFRSTSNPAAAMQRQFDAPSMPMPMHAFQSGINP
jgi:hypothetical protein